MTPRPQKATDAEVFAAAARVMARHGFAPLTLADIAAEAGLTAGALVQRFGSKRSLLLAIAARGADQTRETVAQLRAVHPSPLAALRSYAQGFAHMGESPGALAHHLSYLQLDLTDPEFHRHTMALARATSAALRELLEAAVAAGELAPTVDTGALARTVQVVLSGSLITWAFYRRGPAARWVREDLDAVLGPHRAVSRRKSKRPRTAETGRRRGRVPAPRS
jgi:AcrR family transcriptional regulator